MNDETVNVDGAVNVDDTVKLVSKAWWVLLVVGLLFIAFGVVTLFDVARGATIVALFVGGFLILNGFVAMFFHRGSRAVGIIVGIILVIGGVLVIAYPEYTIATIAVIWGIVLLIGGAGRLVAALAFREYGWGWRLTLGILELVLGLVVLVWPGETAYVLMILLGFYAILAGLVQVIMSFEIKKAPERLAALGAGESAPAF
jgi:uncharacterized membrane protein HdeD (DUF308 family)